MHKAVALVVVWAFTIIPANSQRQTDDIGPQSGAQSQAPQAGPCVLGSASADKSVNSTTGSLRADGQSSAQVIAEFQRALNQDCAQFSANALRQVSVKVSENYIVISGTVPSEADEEQLISIATANADGRTVHNRLSVAK